MDVFVPVFGFFCRSLVRNRQQILILSNDKFKKLTVSCKVPGLHYVVKETCKAMVE